MSITTTIQIYVYAKSYLSRNAKLYAVFNFELKIKNKAPNIERDKKFWYYKCVIIVIITKIKFYLKLIYWV